MKLTINHVDDARTYDGRWTLVSLGANENIDHTGQPPEVGIDETIKIYIRSNKINCIDYATLQLKVHIRILHSRSSSALPMDPCNVMADLRRLFNSIEDTADVEIVSEASRSVRCHRAIMCLRSQVFAAMFSISSTYSWSTLYKDTLDDMLLLPIYPIESAVTT